MLTSVSAGIAKCARFAEAADGDFRAGAPVENLLTLAVFDLEGWKSMPGSDTSNAGPLGEWMVDVRPELAFEVDLSWAGSVFLETSLTSASSLPAPTEAFILL